jgi:hypothetical protein
MHVTRSQLRLDLRERMPILHAMKRFLQGVMVALLGVCLASCGLPGALGRSTGNMFKSLGKLIPSASASGSTR